MSGYQAVLSCDRARRQGMIDADLNVLEPLLADDLRWTHSSGATEGKLEFLAAIAARAVVYQQLEIEQDELRGDAQLVVHQGVLRGQASRDGQAKSLNARFLAVWRATGDQWQLMAWQSTNCSD